MRARAQVLRRVNQRWRRQRSPRQSNQRLGCSMPIDSAGNQSWRSSMYTDNFAGATWRIGARFSGTGKVDDIGASGIRVLLYIFRATHNVQSALGRSELRGETQMMNKEIILEIAARGDYKVICSLPSICVHGFNWRTRRCREDDDKATHHKS